MPYVLNPFGNRKTKLRDNFGYGRETRLEMSADNQVTNTVLDFEKAIKDFSKMLLDKKLNKNKK